MQKIVKRYGTSLVIVIDAEERNIHGMEIGDTIFIKDFDGHLRKKDKRGSWR